MFQDKMKTLGKGIELYHNRPSVSGNIGITVSSQGSNIGKSSSKKII